MSWESKCNVILKLIYGPQLGLNNYVESWQIYQENTIFPGMLHIRAIRPVMVYSSLKT